MPLSFRIRKPQVIARDKYLRAQEEYYQHLNSFPGGPGTDLWEYFAYDFFHDGTIKSLKFNPALSIVQMEIDGCNIRTFDDSGDFEYENPLDFVCTFSGIASFTIENESAKQPQKKKNRRPQYMYSEINTLSVKRLPKEDALCSSLLIQARLQEACIWIKLLFTNLDVLPKDPAHFELLKSNPKTDFPLFSPHA